MKPFDLHGLKTYDLHSRPSKVFLEDLGRPLPANPTVTDWLDSLPRQFAAIDIKRVRDHILRCHRAGLPVVAAMGGHVIKTGCGPYLIDLVRRGVVTAVVMNGSAAIHDFELACAGKTSEDVGPQLREGKFGMARETADAFAIGALIGAEHDRGLGKGLGMHIESSDCKHREVSLVYAAHQAGIPCTVHVALGTDIVHMHPHVSGAALGQASMTDFRLLCSVVASMREGVWLNLGSAVVLPEVFLKAVAVVRNFGHDVSGLVTINFDKEAKYRTQMNVLSRPTAEGIQVIGHHELLIPLLHAAVTAGLAAGEAAPASVPQAA